MSDKKSNPIHDQGEEAADLGLSRDDCPYADGGNRKAWLSAFDNKVASFKADE